MKRSVWMGSVFGGMMLVTAANAQSQVSGDEPSGAASSDQEIIVTARKVAENLQAVPIAITAISGAALTEQSVKNVMDLQRQVPNLFLQPSVSDPQAITLALRGQKYNDIGGTSDPAVGIYIDGVYYPSTIGMAGALIDVDRVEVLRGPQGTLYGRNTTGGALSIYTANPTNTLGGNLSATYGNYNMWNLAGTLNVPLTDNLALRIVGQHGEHDGYGRDAFGRGLADENSTYLRGKLRAQFGGIEAILSGIYQKYETSGAISKFGGLFPADPSTGAPEGGSTTIEAAAELGLPLTPAGFAQAANILNSYKGGDLHDTDSTDPTFSRFTGYVGSLDLKVPVTDDISIRSITAYEHQRKTSLVDFDGTPFTILSARYDVTGHYFSQELQVLGGNKTLNWVAGAYYGNQTSDEFSTAQILTAINAGGNPNNVDFVARNRSIALFAQANWEFAIDWRLTGGIRYSWDRRAGETMNTMGGVCVVPAPGVEVTGVPSSPLNGPSQCPRSFEESFSKPSWLASVDHRFSDQLFGYAKISYGYRSGGLNLRSANVADAFASFQPETVTEYEVGTKLDLFDRRVRLNLAAFHDVYNDIQRSVSIASPAGIPIGLNVNAASGRVNGLEAEARVKITDRFTISGSGGMVDAKYKHFVDLTGDRSNEDFGVPKWTASASANYHKDTSFGSVMAQVDYQWRSKTDLDPSIRRGREQVMQDAYGLLNARIGFTLADYGVDVAAYGKNLTNKDYVGAVQGLAAALGYNQLLIGDPRTYGIVITKHFGGL